MNCANGCATRSRERSPRCRDPAAPAPTSWSAIWCAAPTADRDERAARLRDALADFDAATIATTHEFCQLVLKSLGVAGDTDAGVTLVEEPRRTGHRDRRRPLPAHFGGTARRAAVHPAAALTLARAVVDDPCTELRPAATRRRTAMAAVRLEFATGCARGDGAAASAGCGILGYDDLLTRLADGAGGRGLPGPRPDARALADRDGRRVPGHRPHPVAGHRPRVQRSLHADPDRRSQAGHLRLPRRRHRHLSAGRPHRRRRRTPGHQLAQRQPRWSSSLQTVLRRCRAGRRRTSSCTTSTPTTRAPAGRRTAQRAVPAAGGRPRQRSASTHRKPSRSTSCARHIARRPGRRHRRAAGHAARRSTAQPVRAGRRRGDRRKPRATRGPVTRRWPRRHSGGVHRRRRRVLSRAAKEWLCLLEAFDQPHRSGLVRAAAATMFFGETAEASLPPAATR